MVCVVTLCSDVGKGYLRSGGTSALKIDTAGSYIVNINIHLHAKQHGVKTQKYAD
jgi:hypothetical protein